MKYFTKNWFDMLQRRVPSRLKMDMRANSYSEELYQELYLTEEAEFKKLIEDNAHIDPVDLFEAIVTSRLDNFRRNLPDEILNQVADLRVLALLIGTPSIIEQIEQYNQDLEYRINQVQKEYSELYLKTFGEEGFLLTETYYLHDGLISAVKHEGDDLVIDIEPEPEVRNNPALLRIHLKNAEVKKETPNLVNSIFMYDEIYKNSDRLEWHILCNPQTFAELVVSFDDIECIPLDQIKKQ